MAPFDFEAAHRRIAEYESRTDSAEQRAPTRISFEKQEEDGWAQRFRETVKQKYHDYSLGLTQEQVQRLRNTPISQKQMDYHDQKDEILSTGEIVRFPDGEIFMAILTDGIEDIWGPEQAAKIASKFADDMAVFSEHYPPGPAKHDDKRFKESYEKDLARCTLLNYKVGVNHIGMRREDGNPQQIPCITNETIAGRHKFQPANKFGQDEAIIRQTIDTIMSVFCPGLTMPPKKLLCLSPPSFSYHCNWEAFSSAKVFLDHLLEMGISCLIGPGSCSTLLPIGARVN